MSFVVQLGLLHTLYPMVDEERLPIPPARNVVCSLSAPRLDCKPKTLKVVATNWTIGKAHISPLTWSLTQTTKSKVVRSLLE